jgi:hypothetical protein
MNNLYELYTVCELCGPLILLGEHEVKDMPSLDPRICPECGKRMSLYLLPVDLPKENDTE